MILDVFAKEYGWNVQQILDLPVVAAYLLMDRISQRYAPKNKPATAGSADKFIMEQMDHE